MAMLGIPDIGVLKAVQIDVELAIRVDIDISNEEMYDEPSIPPSLECSWGCILFGT